MQYTEDIKQVIDWINKEEEIGLIPTSDKYKNKDFERGYLFGIQRVRWFIQYTIRKDNGEFIQ